MSATAKRSASRSRWWRVHSWAGLKLSIILSFILATGTLATVSNEIDWLFTPAMRAGGEASPVAWGAAYQTAVTHAGDAQVSLLRAPIDRGFAAQALLRYPDERSGRIWLDPADGRFQGKAGFTNVQQVLRQLHRRMALPNKQGYFLVSLFSILLTMLLVTGLVSYKRFWRGFLRVPRYRRGQLRRFAGDLHRFAALWSLWFVAVIAATGIIYLFQSVDLDPSGPAPPKQEIGEASLSALGHCLDRLPGLAPWLDISLIALPSKAGKPILAFGQGEAILVRDNGNHIAVDPASCTIYHSVEAQSLPLHVRLFLAANPLHFGDFGGLATKLIWFLFGSVLTGLSISGSMIYAMRIAREYKAPTPSAGRRWFLGLGRWRYPTAIIASASLLLTTGALLGPLSFVLADWHLW